MKTRLAAVILIIAMASGAAYGQTGVDLSFDWIGDGAATLGGVGAALTAYLILPDSAAPIPATPDFSAVPALDAAFMGPWNGTADTLSTITEAIAALSPMAFAAFAGDDWLQCAAITAESLLWASAAKDLLKFAFPRLRPWTYYDYSAVPASMLSEAWISFPSGHTTVAFAGAAALATIALGTDKLGPAGPWLAAGALGFAATTGILRMAAGAHFLSDVLVGATIGSGIGWLTAWLHLKQPTAKEGEPTVSVMPTGMGIAVAVGL